MSGMLLWDLRYARRMLRKNLTFTATIVATLALGIGASTVIFSIVDAVLLNPLDYNDPDHVYRIYTMDELGLPQGSTGRVHIDPLIEDGQTVEAAFYGFLNEIFRGEPGRRGVCDQRVPGLGAVLPGFHRAVEPRPRLPARRRFQQHDPELSDLERRFQLGSEHRRVHDSRE